MTGAANAGTYPGYCRTLLEFFIGEVVVNFEIFFRQIGEFDLEEPQKKTMELTDEDWASEAWRQKSYPVHQQTQTISLIFDKDFRHSNPTVHSRFEQFQESGAAMASDGIPMESVAPRGARQLTIRIGPAIVISTKSDFKLK